MKRKFMIMVLAMSMALSSMPVAAADFTDGGIDGQSGISVQEGTA